MADKETAIHDLELGYQEFRGPLNRLEDKDFSEVWLGSWNLSQLLAHMVGWFGEMTAAIERAGRGERPTPEGVDYSNSDAWNEKFAQNAGTGKDSLKEFDKAFDAYRDAARVLPESLFGEDEEKRRPLIGNRLVQGAGIGHFAEHQPELDEWLKSRKE